MAFHPGLEGLLKFEIERTFERKRNSENNIMQGRNSGHTNKMMVNKTGKLSGNKV